MIMYKLIYTGRIEEIEIIRRTDKTVVYASPNSWRSEARENIETEYHSWHETWEDARKHVLHETQKRIKALRLQIDIEQDMFVKFLHMNNPTGDNA